MNKFKFFTLIIVALICNSCTKELPFPEVEDIPLMVVNSLISPDQDLKVHISESCHVKQQNCKQRNITNAVVRLLDKDGSQLSILIHQGDGVYSAPEFNATYDTEYQLEVSVNNSPLAPVSTKAYVPKPFLCSLTGIEESIIADRVAWNFDVEIDDDPSEENYYIISGNFDIVGGTHDRGDIESNGYIEPHFGHFSDDPNAENEQLAFSNDLTTYPLSAVYLSDNNFNGEKYTTKVGIIDSDLNNYNPLDSNSNINRKIIGNIFIKSVSIDMYDYMLSLEELRLRSGDSFAEPKQVYTNIKDGVGIFAGYTEQKFSADLPPSQFSLPSDIYIENNGCTAPCTVRFSSNGGSNVNYVWEFGEGQPSNGAEVEHTYTQAGEFIGVFSAERIDGNGVSWDFEVIIN